MLGASLFTRRTLRTAVARKVGSAFDARRNPAAIQDIEHGYREPVHLRHPHGCNSITFLYNHRSADRETHLGLACAAEHEELAKAAASPGAGRGPRGPSRTRAPRTV